MRLAPMLFILIFAALLLAGCEKARERREARQAAEAATATVQAQAKAPSAPVGATPSEPGTEPGAQSSSEAALPVTGSAGCGTSAATGASIETLESDGVQRSYRLYVPSAYDASKPMPLVLNFHGFRSNAAEQESYSGIVLAADLHGFIAVTPEGTNQPQRWYIYGPIEPGYVDDVAFVDRLLDAVSERYCIDEGRIYAMGISNGGAMTALAGCSLSQRFAAIAPVAGAPYSARKCDAAASMPIVSFHGTDDQQVPFEGGTGGRLGLPVNAVRDNMRAWAEHNGCDLTLRTERVAPDVVLESYGDCVGASDVQLYVIEGGGHTWPGASRDVLILGSTTHSISATEIAWRFFAAHAQD